ncbi:BAG domain protein [Cordyceps fumosorosea ARSEF 2679]|uniref:BAG domain protein n=1 Tax=Cordyceps fumosorosea (strain ARSEF 2679) TaxID=1081104 RepID=A0A167I9C1_CORFA|nr:BAG domain protein [Cordyceps fumosorosea ARSEF 2679]OAA48817.1 BAG domain protein [Cordyceps fumosorosea ARSEF 2679]
MIQPTFSQPADLFSWIDCCPTPRSHQPSARIAPDHDKSCDLVDDQRPDRFSDPSSLGPSSSGPPPYPPDDKVDSTRAAVASPGALQNIGSYITGTLDTLSATLDSSNQYIATTLGLHPSLVYTAAAVLLAVPVTMSRYGWSRGSPYASQPGGVPAITEDDYAYITSQDIDDAGLAAPALSAPRRQHSPAATADDDVLLIKHRGVNYPTHFPHGAIDDGRLQVHDVALRAGLMMSLSERETRSLRFVYKGRQLKSPSAPVREYGIRNNSTLMAILPEGGGFGGRADGSDEETVVVNESKSQRKNRRRKEAKKRIDGGDGGDDAASSPRDNTSSAGAKSPSPIPGAAGQKRINELADEFNSKWLPLCNKFIAKPPADPRKRTDEHLRLSETVMQLILLKLDEVEPEGNPDVRQSRKDLTRTVQDVLRQLDVAAGTLDE